MYARLFLYLCNMKYNQTVMKILIDNGHGENTPGKRSPDGSLREYAYCREIARMLYSKLKDDGCDVQLVTPERYDVPLSERCRRVNAVCRQAGPANVLLVSIHNNAAGGDGQWHEARGFSAHVGMNASAYSKRLAAFLWDEAVNLGMKGNRNVPACKYIAQNLAICRDTLCPAVLTENLFQDNKQDVSFLLSEQGKRAVVDMHHRAILKFIKSCEK